jgi:uncharacterized cupredoxin-like copper-binding protein
VKENRMKRMLLAAVVIAVLGAACGGDGDHSGMNTEGSTDTTGASPGAARTVEITMIDVAFDPKTLNVRRGERIEFIFQNKGKIAHDAFIGDTAAQAEHEKEMRERGQGSVGGDHGSTAADEHAITVDPGKSGRLSYTFDRPGTIEIGCHQPDHYVAGMNVTVTVA